MNETVMIHPLCVYCLFRNYIQLLEYTICTFLLASVVLSNQVCPTQYMYYTAEVMVIIILHTNITKFEIYVNLSSWLIEDEIIYT